MGLLDSLAGLFSVNPQAAPAGMPAPLYGATGGLTPDGSLVTPGQGATPAPGTDPTDTGQILARLSSAALAQNGQGAMQRGPLSPSPTGPAGGLPIGALPDVRGKSKGNAFISGLSSGLNAAQTRSDQLNASDHAGQQQLFGNLISLMGAQHQANSDAETARYHDMLGGYYKGLVANGAAKADGSGDLTPREQINTARQAAQLAGYTPWLPNWDQMLSPDEVASRRANAAAGYKAITGKSWPLDMQGNPDPQALNTTTAGAAKAAAGAPAPGPTPASPPAATPAPQAAPRTLVPVTGPKGERALWDPQAKTFVQQPGAPQVDPGGAMGGLDPSAGF